MNDDRYEAIRKRMTERYRGRAEFYGHLISFVICNLFAWVVIPTWLGNDSAFRSIVMGIMLVSSTGWLIGLLIHGMNYILTEMRERAIDREIERERRWLAGEATDEKPKRSRLERLTDDEGELLDDVLDAQDSGYKRARGS